MNPHVYELKMKKRCTFFTFYNDSVKLIKNIYIIYIIIFYVTDNIYIYIYIFFILYKYIIKNEDFTAFCHF